MAPESWEGLTSRLDVNNSLYATYMQVEQEHLRASADGWVVPADIVAAAWERLGERDREQQKHVLFQAYAEMVARVREYLLNDAMTAVGRSHLLPDDLDVISWTLATFDGDPMFEQPTEATVVVDIELLARLIAEIRRLQPKEGN